MAGQIRLVLSYVLDWIVVVVIAAAGGGLSYVSGYHRPFALTDSAIAYPNRPDIISTSVLFIVAVVAPALIIALVCIAAAFLSPSKTETRSKPLRTMLWEIHAAWLGLCFGLAVTLFITSGLKDVIGKPRPDLLARCQPDLSDIAKYVVGGFGNSLDSESAPFVTSAICRQQDKKFLDDGFAAFPSGHSSISSAGMVFLSLWLAARFSVAIPYLDHMTARGGRGWAVAEQQHKAAPPVWQTAIVLAPIAAALFICSSRYADFHHAGFDIICGSLLGTLVAWASFRMYHLPVRRSRGLLAWGPRSAGRAFIAHTAGDDRKLLQSDEEQAKPTDNYELRPVSHGRPQRSYTGGTEDPILPQQPPYQTLPNTRYEHQR